MGKRSKERVKILIKLLALWKVFNNLSRNNLLEIFTKNSKSKAKFEV